MKILKAYDSGGKYILDVLNGYEGSEKGPILDEEQIPEQAIEVV